MNIIQIIGACLVVLGLTISFASQLRHGANTNKVINTARGRAEFMYVDATIGWIDID